MYMHCIIQTLYKYSVKSKINTNCVMSVRLTLVTDQ